MLCFHIPLLHNTVEEIVKGIEILENSNHHKPFGIESIKLKGKTRLERWYYARKICINSVNNSWGRWNKAGKPEDFLKFVNYRYCPSDKNWHSKLKKILKQRWFDFESIK